MWSRRLAPRQHGKAQEQPLHQRHLRGALPGGAQLLPLGPTVLAGAFTLALLILPVIIVATQEALKAVQNYTPDVILLDMMMPGLTGRETLVEMRKIPALANTPAIFMTARAQVVELNALRDAGAAEVISKPFDPMSLADQIKAVLDA